MAKKAAPPTTPTPAAAEPQLRSHRTPLRRSPRFVSPPIQESALLSLPYPVRNRKRTTKKPTTKKPPKQQTEILASQEKQVRRSERNLRTPPDSSRRRSPRLAAAAVAISPNQKKLQASRSVEAPQSLRRSSRLAAVSAAQVNENGILDSREAGKEAKSNSAKKKGQQKEIKKVDVSVEERKGITGGESAHCCGPGDWTEELEKALRRAYLLARPSPHFWKKVSRMVPGKSAQECFNKIHANLATPPQHEPRSRAKKTNFSPIGHLTLSDKPVDDMKMKVRKGRSGKRKSLLAQKTVRHLLKKHRLADQTQETDCFLVLENASPLELPVSSPGTPDYSSSSPGFLLKCSERSSSGHVKFLTRFKTSNANPSPEVLKPIKNIALHERYIDHLHAIDARRTARLKTANSIAATHASNNKMETRDLKASRVALVTEAREAIGHFRHMQANALNYDTDGTTSDNPSADSDNEDDCDIV